MSPPAPGPARALGPPLDPQRDPPLDPQRDPTLDPQRDLQRDPPLGPPRDPLLDPPRDRLLGPIPDAPLEESVRPPSPYRLPLHRSADGTVQPRGSALVRYFVLDGAPVAVSAWQPRTREVRLRAAPAPAAGQPIAGESELRQAVARLRFALGVDADLTEFHRRFARDRLLGPVIRRAPHLRPARQPSPWEAFAWAVAGQLIEARRAAAICRAIVARWGPAGPGGLRDAPSPEAIAARAPAELESVDLSGPRSVALRRAAAAVAAGRIDPADPADDARLLRIPEIGQWTVQCLGLFGRGEPDALPAGDLAYLKLVGALLGLGRRAETPEVEQFFEPYRPWRGLAGTYLRSAHRSLDGWRG